MSLRYFFENSEFLPKYIDKFSYRSYQVELAEYIRSALSDYETSVIEAPTGSGKTLAYLLSAFYLKQKTIISTKTKQLMNQILNKDIPLLKKIFTNDELTITSLKGRKNYFCYYRYYKYIEPNREMFPDVTDWFGNAGEICEIPAQLFDFSVLDKMSADSIQCVGSKCPYFDKCPFYMKKDMAANSDLVITNHFMLLSDMAMRQKNDMSFNFEFADNIIFDEAHSLPDIFPRFIGEEISLGAFMAFLKENRAFLNENGYGYLVSKFEKTKSMVSTKKIIDDVLWEEIEGLFGESKKQAESFFDEENLDIYKKYRDKLDNIYNTEGVKLAEPSGNSINLRSMPLSVSDSFSEAINKSCISSVFISATLSVNNSFNYFCSEIGLEDIKTKSFASQINFMKNGTCYVTDKDLSKAGKMNIYKKIVDNAAGGCLLIFNSVEMMNAVYEFLSENTPDKDLFLQTKVDLSRITLGENTVVLGCSIVREGIDFSGGSLKCVVLDKLPFENISDVYLDARKKDFDEKFGGSFMNFYLPRAVIYFKQAIGRLIRHENDSGVWIILDNRVLKKSYGKYFLSVLEGAEIRKSLDELL